MPEPAEMSRSPEDPRKTGSTEGGGSSMAVGSSGVGEGGESGEVNGRKASGGGGEADPFADYMWMENEEEYNRQVEEELREQDFLERCFQEMLEEEEERDWFIPSRDYSPGAAGQIQNHFNGLSLADGSPEDIAQKSNLNPEAREFVPGVKY